jgi:hypothetical protein
MVLREVFTTVLAITLLIFAYQMDQEPPIRSLDEYVAGHRQIHQKMEALRNERALERIDNEDKESDVINEY